MNIEVNVKDENINNILFIPKYKKDTINKLSKAFLE